MNAVRYLVAIGVVGLAGISSAQETLPMGPSPRAAAPPSAWAGTGAYDFGDFTSQTLTAKAWEALKLGDHAAVAVYTKTCIELYEAEAKTQQASLRAFAPEARVFEYWALNDVATCYFILGESLRFQKRYPEAVGVFERVIGGFGFAQCWDPRGWFWKVAEGARVRLTVLR